MLVAFLDFREEVVTRRTKYLLAKARDSRAHPGRPGDRGRQYRRSDPPDPDVAGLGRGARGADGARLAGPRHGAADRPDRRPAPHDRGGWNDPPLRRAGARDPGAASRASDRARPRRNRRGAEQARRRDRRLPRHPRLARAADGHHSRRTGRGEDRVRRQAPNRDSRSPKPTWRTRTSSSARIWWCS